MKPANKIPRLAWKRYISGNIWQTQEIGSLLGPIYFGQIWYIKAGPYYKARIWDKRKSDIIEEKEFKNLQYAKSWIKKELQNKF